MANTESDILETSRDAFIEQWGILGSRWGINRTIGRVQALLIASVEALSTDDVMERLQISRGNAHGALKELVNWGLASQTLVPGDRKDYYVAEKEPWRIFTIVARERKRREIVPALETLKTCERDRSGLKGAEGRAFHAEMKELADFVDVMSVAMDWVATSERGTVLNLVMKQIRKRSAG